MSRCEYCFAEYDEKIAMGVCPYCGYHDGFRQKDPRYLPIGTMIHNRYVIGGVIGDGGFGITYRAWDMTLQTIVALKEYYQRGVVNRIPGTAEVFIAAPDRAEEFHYGKERLLREAQIVSQFQASAIVRVNDYFEENGTSYMVMEFLDYPTLTDCLRENNKPLSVEAVTSIGIQLCEALQEIHAAGVLHRDIAPDNIFLTDEGKVKIIDFGSARLSKEDTLERLILVKEGFSPIEQYEVIDPQQNLQQPWTDIYAVGATLYYLLTGVRPEESRVRKTNVDEGRADIQEPKELNPLTPDNLNNTIMMAMAINSHERFKSAEDLKKALIGDTKVQPLRIIRKRRKIIRAASISAALLIAALVILIRSYTGYQQYDEITLEPAEISLWYCIGASDADDVWGQALTTVVEEKAATAQFDDVTVELRGIPASEYAQALAEADARGDMPTIFQCVDQTAGYMAGAGDTAEIIRNLDAETRDCWFVQEYRGQFQEMGCIPTGFDIPVIYVNTAIVTDYAEGTDIATMESLLGLAGGELRYMPIAIDPDAEYLFAKMFPDYGASRETLTVVDGDAFLNEEAAVYLTTISNYNQVKDSLAGIFAIAEIEGAEITCCFRDFWAISQATPEETMAAQVLLAYFYTSYAQDYLYLRESATALPVSKSALSQYAGVHWQLEDILGKCDQYTFDE